MGVEMITVRPFRRSDIRAAVDLESSHRRRPWTRQTFEEELSALGRSYLAATSDSLVGFGGIMAVGDEAHVTNLLVGAAVRRRGVGLRLMRLLIGEAIRAGARHLTLEVRSRNGPAIALYRRLGLTQEGVRRDYYLDDDALIMWARDIDRPGQPWRAE